jgi:4-hydroxy-tetrahydrodipicolinate reductase
MSQIKVIVNGALGRMGQQVIAAVAADPDLQLLGGSDIKAERDFLTVPGLAKKLPLNSHAISLIEMFHPDVVVDFTIPTEAMGTARLALKNGASLVMGTTGLTEKDLKEIDSLASASRKGAMVAPNFAIGAVVMMHLARIASRYFDNAEIIELHHDKKLDAPSGTALATAKMMSQAHKGAFTLPKTEKETLKGTRGGATEGISIHSVRMPGFVASQEILFGTLGQTLSIRHDTISRECFMPGVLLAIKEVVKRQGLIYGLDALLDLGD